MGLGDRLAAAREARGFSLEDLAHRTKIPVGRLRALEASAYELLPPPTFTRGYLRAYAREVGIDPESFVVQYEGERPVPPKETVAASIDLAAEDDDAARTSNSRNALLTAAGIVLVTALIWTGREPSPAATPVVAPHAKTPPATDVVGTTGNAAPAEVQSVSVVLAAERLCWVDASADGTRVIYRLLQPGEKAKVDAKERVALRVGDAGALTISVNGAAPQAAGASGEVRMLTFDAR